MSVISLSSEDEDVEDECSIINSIEGQKTLQKTHTIFVVDDDESNEMNCGLPELEKEMNSGQLPIKATEEENSQDPFAMCSEFDMIDSENKESIITYENTQLKTNVKHVHIKEIINNCTTNTTISKTNSDIKVNKPKTDNNDLLNTRKEISTESSDPLHSANADDNIQDSASFKKRLAECLALLIKDKAIKTNNSSKQDMLLCLDRENMTSVDSIINKVSKSSFDVDGYIDLIFNKYNAGCSKNKIEGRRGQKINTESNLLNDKDIEGPKNNQVSTENDGNPGYVGRNEREKHDTIKTNRKRGRKKGWRKHPQPKLNSSLCMSIDQGSNLGDDNEPSHNRSLKGSSCISNHLLGHKIQKEHASEKSATITGMNIPNDSTQQSQALSDPKSSNTNLDKRKHPCTSYTSFKATEKVLGVGSVNDSKDLQDKDTPNTTIDSNLCSNQNNLNQISINSQLKTYTCYYKIVFDDNGEYLCMKMGDIVLLTVKEARSCKSRIATAQKFTCQQLRANEIKLVKTNFYETLMGFKSSFLPPYIKLLQKIIASEVHCNSYDQLMLLLITWFLKIYLRVTTLAPEFMDCLNEIKVSVRTLIPEKHPISKPVVGMFACNAAEFESKCCTVVQYMHSIFNSTNNVKEDGNGCNNSRQHLNQPIKNVHKPEMSVHNPERDVNVKPVESNLAASKPTTILEHILKGNDTRVVKHNNKALELQQLEPPPYNCNKPGRGIHQEKPGTVEARGNLGRDSRLIKPFNSEITSLSTLSENSIHANEVALHPRTTNNYNEPQTQFNISGAYNSSQDHASVFSTANTHSTKNHEFTQRNLTERGRPISQTVTSTLPDDLRASNSSATQYANQYNIDTHSNNIRSHEQMTKPSEMSASRVYSSEGSRVPYSTNNNLPFQPELGIENYTTVMNHQVKRKCTDSNQYFSKKCITDKNSISSKWVGDNTGNSPLNHLQPSSIVNNSLVNSKTYIQHSLNGIRPTSLHPRPPPSYHQYLSNQYHYPPQQNNAMQRRFQGPSSSSGYHKFQGEIYGSKHHEHHIGIQENNHYSLETNHPRNCRNSPSINTRPSNESVHESTSSNERHIAVKIHNFNITNVLPTTSVIKHANSQDTSCISSRKEMQQENVSIVPDHTPKETIHYLGSELRNDKAT